MMYMCICAFKHLFSHELVLNSTKLNCHACVGGPKGGREFFTGGVWRGFYRPSEVWPQGRSRGGVILLAKRKKYFFQLLL